MEITNQKQKPSTLLCSRVYIILLFLAFSTISANGQCLSAANPVGGIENLMTQEQGSLRLISFYKYAQSTQYYEGSRMSDYEGISKGYYNYLSFMAGYGLFKRLTLETQAGYFLNKSQVYNVDPSYTLVGRGLSHLTLSVKYGLGTNHVKRRYLSVGAGFKIPGSRDPKAVDNVQLPYELQPSTGAYGLLVHAEWVKEIPEPGLRFFATSRFILNFKNKGDLVPGKVFYNSFYVSKHLMHPAFKGNWTVILQVRNEIRTPDRLYGDSEESTGGVLLFLVPQINYTLKEKWNCSLMADFPLYQYFRGTQLGAGWGITFTLSRTLLGTY